MEKRKDVIIEEGRAFFIGFIIAGGLVAIFWLAIGVNAQVMSQPIPTEFQKTISQVTATGTLTTLIDKSITEMDAKTLIDYQAKLNAEKQAADSLASKYAKLYDSCKNR